MREPADQTGVAVCGADCRQNAGSETAKRGHAAGAAQRQIIYQANVTMGKPDFLYVDEEHPLILDTKYKPRYGAGIFDVEDIRQLAGYARDRKALKKLGIQEAEEQSSAVVPCVIIYPEVHGGDVKFDGLRSPIDQVQLEVAPIGELVGFYCMGFPLPVLNAGDTDGLFRGAGGEPFCVSGEAGARKSVVPAGSNDIRWRK